MTQPHTIITLAMVGLALLGGCKTTDTPTSMAEDRSAGRVHYLEIVCDDVDKQCEVFSRLHGVSFGPGVADLGGARVASMPSGTRLAVRAPLAAHERPIIRTYLAVEDIDRAVSEAEAAGAVIAYPPTVQGDTGTWAIYILGDLQFGLWQR